MTAIVRELVTRLSFSFNRSNLDRFEKSIIGFKFRFAAITAAAGIFAKRVVGFFSDIADASRSTRELAEQTGIAFKDLATLSKTAEDFDFDPKLFERGLIRISELLREAQSGYGKLFEIQQDARGQLNLEQFVNTQDVQGAFIAILRYVETLERIPDRIAAIRDILGGDSEKGVLRIVKQGTDTFLQAAEANREYGESFQEMEPGLDNFRENIKSFDNALNKLTRNLAQIFLPLLTEFFTIANNDIESFRELAKEDWVKRFTQPFEILANFLSNAGTMALDVVTLRNFIGNPNGQNSEMLTRFQDLQINNEMRLPSNITTNIEITVPPTTDAELPTEIATAIRNEIDNVLDIRTREIISNNPQSE